MENLALEVQRLREDTVRLNTELKNKTKEADKAKRENEILARANASG